MPSSCILAIVIRCGLLPISHPPMRKFPHRGLSTLSRLRKWRRPAALVVAIVVVSQLGVSLLVRTHRVHAYLVRHLERAFGRPVEVARFSVLLVPTPRFDAERITVGEDPAFGNEYFL